MRTSMAKPLYHNKDQIERFEAEVNKRGPNDCWPWTGSVNGNGIDTGKYGSFMGRGAHRVAYEIAYGYYQILNHPTWQVGHLCRNYDQTIPCDVRVCCNPKHLTLVDPKDDMRRRGINMRKSKSLTKQQVLMALEKCLIDNVHHIDVVTTYFPNRITTQAMWRIIRGESHEEIHKEFTAKHNITKDKINEIMKAQTTKYKAKKRAERKKE
jgi:hypothetical protein